MRKNGLNNIVVSLTKELFFVFLPFSDDFFKVLQHLLDTRQKLQNLLKITDNLFQLAFNALLPKTDLQKSSPSLMVMLART